jgi:hypothetical protein
MSNSISGRKVPTAAEARKVFRDAGAKAPASEYETRPTGIPCEPGAPEGGAAGSRRGRQAQAQDLIVGSSVTLVVSSPLQ